MRSVFIAVSAAKGELDLLGAVAFVPLALWGPLLAGAALAYYYRRRDACTRCQGDADRPDGALGLDDEGVQAGDDAVVPFGLADPAAGFGVFGECGCVDALGGHADALFGQGQGSDHRPFWAEAIRTAEGAFVDYVNGFALAETGRPGDPNGAHRPGTASASSSSA